MTARRSSSDPVSHHLERGERIVWRHRPHAAALIRNSLPGAVLVAVITAFLAVIGANVVATALPPPPIEPDAWLFLPATIMLFSLVLLYFLLAALWSHLRFIFDSWETYYALTDRRFLVVSGERVFAYDASHFHKMEPLGGEPGAQVLAFDWRLDRKRRYRYRDRLAGLPDAHKLETLIRRTLRA